MKNISRNKSSFDVIIIQPAIPSYRLDFFDRLSNIWGDKFRVYSSDQNLGALTANQSARSWKRFTGPTISIFSGLDWQAGVLPIKIKKGDIVVICGAPRCITNILFLIKARLLGAKTVWWGHYWSSSSKKWRFIIRTVLMRLSKFLLFYTDKEIEEYTSFIGKKPSNVFALNNGIPMDEIKKNRIYYDAETRDQRLLFIGRLTKKTSLEVLLHALSNSILLNFHLEVIGDGEFKDNLHALAMNLGIENMISWHGALTNEVEIANVANRCSMFVYPGGVGLSLIHAMGYGLPAILHNNRYKHMPEIAAFNNGTTGLSFSFNDPVSLAEKIVEAHQDPELMNKWAATSTAIVDGSFNTKVMAERFIDMTDKIISIN